MTYPKSLGANKECLVLQKKDLFRQPFYRLQGQDNISLRDLSMFLIRRKITILRGLLQCLSHQQKEILMMSKKQ
jgi:hypothetical protein